MREDVTPKYMAAAKRMFERLGIDAGGLKAPEDVRGILLKTLKEPSVREAMDAEVLFEGESRRFIIHEDGGVSILKRDFVAVLFLGKECAGFAEFKNNSKEAHFVFYCDKEGSAEVDVEERRYVRRDPDGKTEVLRIAEEDYATVPDEIGRKLDERWLTVCEVMKEHVPRMSFDAALIMALAGKPKEE